VVRGDLLKRRADRVTADLVVLSDTLLWRADAPAVCTGLRGMVSAQLEVRGPQRDVHSGAVSGPAPNPVIEVARLIAQLHDEHGRITLPGFYDDVIPPDDDERAAIAALPYSDEDWLARSETSSIGGEEGFTVLERLWLRPAAEVLTVIAGDPAGPARGAILSLARADFSIRPEESGQEPYRTPPDLPALAALREAMAEGFGREVGQMRNAGGSPASLLHDVTDAPRKRERPWSGD
jgi:acetylornithine deacetylase/succinyl-diaminopimelate desuccinylase-like protein